MDFFKKLLNKHQVLGHDVTDETLENQLGLHLTSFIKQKSYSLFRTDIILERLAQFAVQGKSAHIAALLNIRPDLRIKILFTLAGLGAQDKMQAILKEHPEDLLLVHPLTDISGAQFSSVTLLQHAIWTQDLGHMGIMFLDCLPRNEQGEQIRRALKKQFSDLFTHGVVYQLKGEEHKERHFNLMNLIKALSTYVSNYQNWIPSERQMYWCSEVGSQQQRLPAIVRHHYCDYDELFRNNPSFSKPHLTRSLTISYDTPNSYEALEKITTWSESLSGLGSDFGICRGISMVYPYQETAPELRDAAIDLMALETLQRVRNDWDMRKFIKRLNTPIQNQKEDVFTMECIKPK
ncbi:SidC homolog [Legionella wadsworthii]|uniref:SidC homolog n=1 Tax=Legionella wadsworthii TaxID=28088 RepID=A0A378LSR9_9GAMM|nr:hypothetical protein [Legionella wadsworthii]STY28879.1 SidC homolog [Legionella wadsworthii]